MNFLKANWLVLSLVILTLMAEMFHMLFVNIPFNDSVNLDTPIYYLINQFGLLTFIPSVYIFISIPKQKIASLYMAFILILWNLKEMFDEITYITKKGTSVFDTNVGQISLLCTSILFGIIGYLRWKS